MCSLDDLQPVVTVAFSFARRLASDRHGIEKRCTGAVFILDQHYEHQLCR